MNVYDSDAVRFVTVCLEQPYGRSGFLTSHAEAPSHRRAQARPRSLQEHHITFIFEDLRIERRAYCRHAVPQSETGVDIPCDNKCIRLARESCRLNYSRAYVGADAIGQLRPHSILPIQ